MTGESRTADARGARNKRVLLIVIALASGLAVLAWSQTWFTVDRIEGADLAEPQAAAGSVAAPPLMALALAGLASVAGLALAGLVLRWVLGGLVTVLGAVAVTTSALALADPVRAISGLVTELTGVSGVASTGRLVDPEAIAASVWPWGGILSGLILAAAGIAVIVTGRRWPSSARRFEARLADAETGLPVDSVDRWDALSGGGDPTATAAELADDDDEWGDVDDEPSDGPDVEETRPAGPGEEPLRND